MRPSPEQPSPPGPACFNIEYGEGLTFSMMIDRHQAPEELGSRVERLLERMSRGRPRAAEPEAQP